MLPRAPLKAPLRSVRRWLGAVAALSALPSYAAALTILPALGRPDEVRISGRVLNEHPPKARSALAGNVRALTADAWAGAPVELRLEGQVQQATSDERGHFSVLFRFAPPQAAGIHEVEGRVPGATAKAAVQLLSPQARLVISDLDDTLSVTHVLSKRKLAEAVFLQDGETQPAVPGMAALLRCLSSGPVPAGVAVVTGTPIQLAHRAQVFFARNDFPFAALYPRALGADTLSGYKQPVIRQLLQSRPHRAVCLGDSGEQDPEVYEQMRREFPGRISRIYIRNVGRDENPERFRDMLLFTDPAQAAADATARGLMADGCLDQERRAHP